MVDFAKVRAIDFHTHAEEPCNANRDDGYNEFQAGMASYFKNPAGAKGMLRLCRKPRFTIASAISQP